MPWINEKVCTGYAGFVWEEAKIKYLGKYIRAFNLENKVNQKSIEKLEAIKKELE